MTCIYTGVLYFVNLVVIGALPIGGVVLSLLDWLVFVSSIRQGDTKSWGARTIAAIYHKDGPKRPSQLGQYWPDEISGYGRLPNHDNCDGPYAPLHSDPRFSIGVKE